MMKKVIFAILAILTVTIFASCDPCRKVDCLNGGVCNDGDCVCPSGYEGTRCESAKRPIQMRINKVRILNYPLTNGGSSWDLTTTADLSLTIDPGTSASGSFYSSSTYCPDVVGSGSCEFVVNTTINNLSENWTFGAWDYDSPDPDDFMGGVYFPPIDYSGGFPSSFRVGNNSVLFELEVTWIF